MTPRTFAPLSLAALAACASQEVDLGGNYHIAAAIPPIANPAIDVLFVIDASPSMQDEQATIGARAQDALFDVIAAAVDGEPDLHVGVITPDLALGVSTGDVFCENAPAQTDLHVGTCAGITDPYLIDVDDGSGGRTRNYEGTLAEAFACIAAVGDSGCGFERPLDAVTSALANPTNAGFLRPEALLVVIFITDEDDCSGVTALYDPENGELSPHLGDRCFLAATTCAEGTDTPGPKTGCEAIADSPLLRPLDGFVDALVAHKGGDPTQVMVAAIAGPDQPIDLTVYEDGWTAVTPTCTSTTPDGPQFAQPAVRLSAMLGALPGRSWFETLCAPLDASLRRTANSIGDVAGRRACLTGALRDADTAAPGVQPTCQAYLATGAFTADEARRTVPRCTDEVTDQCFRVVPGAPTCQQWDPALGVELVGLGQAADEALVVECL